MEKKYQDKVQGFLRMWNAVVQIYSDAADSCFTRFQDKRHRTQQRFINSRSDFQCFRQRYSLLICTSLLLLLLSGCEKVIDVDLSESEPAIVIEGNLSFGEGDLEVKVTKTGSYFSNEPTEKVKNAEVYLENGPAFNLKAKEIGNGLYKLTGLPVNLNSVYRLTVKTDKEEYTGVSELNPLVKIDSLTYEYHSEQVFFEGGYRLSLYFNDPPGKENYYRVKVYRNGELFNGTDDIIVFDDGGFDGKNLRMRLRGQPFEQGDTAKVEMLSIDKNTWQYFSTLSEMSNLNPGSPSPANPITNLSNGALGYFSVWAVSSDEIIIPEQ
ncbi:MAG: DUF4249 domain-containing protein [Mariniphaga sp.]